MNTGPEHFTCSITENPYGMHLHLTHINNTLSSARYHNMTCILTFTRFYKIHPEVAEKTRTVGWMDEWMGTQRSKPKIKDRP